MQQRLRRRLWLLGRPVGDGPLVCLSAAFDLARPTGSHSLVHRDPRSSIAVAGLVGIAIDTTLQAKLYGRARRRSPSGRAEPEARLYCATVVRLPPAASPSLRYLSLTSLTLHSCSRARSSFRSASLCLRGRARRRSPGPSRSSPSSSPTYVVHPTFAHRRHQLSSTRFNSAGLSPSTRASSTTSPMRQSPVVRRMRDVSKTDCSSNLQQLREVLIVGSSVRSHITLSRLTCESTLTALDASHSAQSLSRNLLAAVLPLAGPSMFSNMTPR